MSKIWGFSGNCGTKDKAFAVDALSPGASREISQWSSEKIFISAITLFCHFLSFLINKKF
jgi:hypothetical protein